MTYSTGLIGAGFISESHAEAYQEVDGIEITAVADTDEEQLREFGQAWSVPASERYRDHHAMLESEKLDALSVTTPSFLHHDHVLDAVRTEGGPDVIWCEKPIALSVADATEMVEACAEADVELVINHMRRFSDLYTALRDLIREGFLGKIESVAVQSPRELLRNGTHTVDLLVFLLDATGVSTTGHLTGQHGMPEHVVNAAPETYDDSGGGGSIVLDSGAYISLDHTAPRGHAPNAFQFVGSGGQLRVEDGGEWDYWRLDETDTGYGFKNVKSPLPDQLSIEDRDLFFVGASHIVDLLDGAAENRSPGEDAAHVLELLIAMFVSHYTGSRISLPLSAPLRKVEVFSW